MLNMFRTFIRSRVGLIVVFLVLGVIAIAFAAGDVTGMRSMASGSANVIAKVGNHEITENELSEEIDRVLKEQRSQGQNITMEQFLASPMFDQVVERLINYATIEEFAKSNGMLADSTLVDSAIANNPAFQGFDGKFSQTKFEGLLAENRVSPAKFRDALSSEYYLRWLIGDPAPISQLPVGVAAPYASLALERRTGTIALIRWNDMDPGADPDAKTLQAYYERNKAHYMVPPRRILRYAIVKPDQFKASSAATEAEISDAYAKAGVRFAASEKRTIRQLVMLDQAAANAAAAEVKGGKSIADVAKSRGLEPRTFDAVDKGALAKDTSVPVAEAAFSAAQGATVGPVKGPLGWVVMHVDTVTPIAAKSLAQAHDTLAAEITQAKIAKTIGTLRQSLDDSAGNGANFDSVMAQGKLTPLHTAALAPDGTDPSVPNSKPDPALAAIVQAGFAADPNDSEPVVVPLGQDGSFAVIGVEKSIPAQAKPLASIQKEVVRDYLQDITLQKARKAATDVVNQVNKGTPLQQALAATGLRTLLPPKGFDMTRQDIGKLASPQMGPPPQFVQAFQTPPKRAKMIEAPGRAGYYIVYVATTEEHDASGNAQLMAAVQQGLGQRLQEESIEQFVESMKKNVKVTRYPAVIQALRASLGRTGAQ